MWERFTDKARRTVFRAQEEAGRLGENFVSTEHLLLGIISQPESLAGQALVEMGIDLGRVRSEIEAQVPRGEGHLGQDMQLTPRAKRVIDLAYDEARQMNSGCIGTEHLLLGLIREGDGLAPRILRGLGVEYGSARAAVRSLQVEYKSEAQPAGKPGTGGKAPNLGHMGMSLRGRDLLSIGDLSREEIDHIFATTAQLKESTKNWQIQSGVLTNRTLAMIFEKPSLRTRVTFEVGMTQLGGHAIYLQPSDIQLGARESIADAARNLERWVDAIMARVFSHNTVTELAKHAQIPVINALSDLEHPCQALADFHTIKEHKGELKGLKLAYVGDGNNVCHSLLLLAAKVGTSMSVGCPAGYEPNPDVVAEARKLAEATGATIEITSDPVEAVKDADAVYTDVWASMGQESEKAEREKVFPPYQVNDELLKHAKEDVIFLHCLPAHRGDEVTDGVMDGPHSVVFDEAENRLHVQKALLMLLVQNKSYHEYTCPE